VPLTLSGKHLEHYAELPASRCRSRALQQGRVGKARFDNACCSPTAASAARRSCS
jgi:hypothetical protein